MESKTRKLIRKMLREQIEDVPTFLYHGTYKPILDKIKEEGLGGPSAVPAWSVIH